MGEWTRFIAAAAASARALANKAVAFRQQNANTLILAARVTNRVPGN